jgi:molecular chaperone DnaK
VAPVLPRNSRLPAQKTYEVTTIAEGQRQLEIALFQGDAPHVGECEYLGTVRIEDRTAAPTGGLKLAMELAVGNEGILSVRARNLETGDEVPAQLATVDTPETLTRKLHLAEPPAAPRGARPIEAARGRREEAGASRASQRQARARGGRPSPREEPAPAAAPPAKAPAGPSSPAPPDKERKSLLARLFRR